MNFAIIFIVLAIIAFGSIFYFWTRFHKFSFINKLEKRSRVLSWIVALLPVLLIGYLTYLSVFTMIVVILHLFVIWLLADFLAFIIRKITKKTWRRYWQGLGALIFTGIYLAGGYYVAHHVVETDYRVLSEKAYQKQDSIRIAVIADSHLGATFDGEGFARHIESIEAANPDILVIVGDFVDDDTVKADMVRACQALGQMNTTYGVYFVYGNHDKGYFSYRDFSTEDLVVELEKNNVIILEDELVDIGECFQLVGRQDKSTVSRASIDQLMTIADESRYSIVLDHQPADYANEAAAGVDLVLSGHTHGGWLFPMGIISKYTGPDDRVYGTELRDASRFIVTSGISDWALPFKTGTRAEYLIVDVSLKNDLTLINDSTEAGE